MAEGGVLVLALIVAVAGCGGGPGGPAPAGAHTTAIVVAHHRNELAPVLGTADLERLRMTAADPDADDAVVYVVSTGRSERVDLEPRRPSGDIERGQRIDALVEERLTELQHTITRAAEQSTGTDLLRGLSDAEHTGAATIIVLSSGLSTVDPLDLRVSGFDRDPADLARELRDQDQLPELAGRDVGFSGLGRTAGAQQRLGLREEGYLRALWLAVCTAAGGHCRTDDSVRPADPPVSSLDQPVVAVPVVSTTRGPDGVETFEVPAPLLFAPDSCALVDPVQAASVLAPLTARLRDGRVTVAISGRTAPVGGDGVVLSTCRARAAEGLLRGLAVPEGAIIDVRGDGSLLDPPSASRGPDGRLDPDKLAALRRVVFTVVPGGATR